MNHCLADKRYYLHQQDRYTADQELGVNDSILSRLGMKESDFSYKENQEYLQGAIECEIKFVNVEKELAALHKKCTSLGIPMFEHSMPAINYVMNMET